MWAGDVPQLDERALRIPVSVEQKKAREARGVWGCAPVKKGGGLGLRKPAMRAGPKARGARGSAPSKKAAAMPQLTPAVS